MSLILHGMLNAPYPDDPSKMGVVAWIQARGAMREASTEIARLNAEIARLKGWRHYPIDMPLTAEGMGPATIGVDAASVVYEVWDENCTSHGAFPNLREALDLAMRLNAAPDAPA
jgi:hypothetical protein